MILHPGWPVRLFWILSLSICSSMGIVDVEEFFNGIVSSDLTWAHGVNSQAKLQDALEGSAMMLEADIVMGAHVSSTKGPIPVMAHPPETSSDLSFAQFLDAILKVNNVDGLKKGIKLDFKQIEAVEPVLRLLEHHEAAEELEIPVWLNADILKGPVRSTKTPIDAQTFLNLTKTYLDAATLSLGWTTRFGRDEIKADPTNPKLRTIKRGSYTEAQVSEMIDLILSSSGEKPSLTFPVRAGPAVESSDVLLRMITQLPNFPKLTIWSAIDDPVDMKKLEDFFTKVGKDSIYTDLPFDLKTGPEIIPDPVLEPALKAEYSSGSKERSVSSGVFVPLLLLIAYLFL